jgi:hypothetical protein
MIYECTGFLAFFFVAFVIYASVTLDIRNSYSRYRRQKQVISAASA